MNSIIVPTDFSETSKNAARFAAHLTKHVADARLILYNVFDAIESGSDGTPLESDDAGRKQIMELALKSVETELSGITDAPISIVAEEDHHFMDSLERYVRHNDIQMIVMGITGATRLGQIFMGSNTLNIIK